MDDDNNIFLGDNLLISDKTKKRYLTFAKKAKIEAVDAIKDFLEYLDFNPNIFNHIYNTKIVIDKTEKNASAQFIPDEDMIIINLSFIDTYSKDIYSNTDEERLAIINMAVAIIHEMIHATRSVLIEDSLNKVTIDSVRDKRIRQYSQHKNEHNIDTYRKLLIDMLDKPYVINFRKYIPIKITINKNGKLNVIAYNRETKNYVEYANQDFPIEYKKDIDQFYNEIGLELNNNNYEITNTIYTYTDIEEAPTILTADEYYHPYSNNNHSFDKYNLPFLFQLTKDNRDLQYNAMERIIYASDFEESIIETLSNIIIRTKYDSQPSIEKMANKIINSPSSQPDEKISAEFIKKMGPDMVRWFLTAAYDEYYDDELEKIFKEEYDNLLKSFSNIYRASTKGKKISQNDVERINDIVESKVK